MSLEHVDTLLAFSVVMLLLSLVITTLVQAVVAALNLRGRNLAWGLEALLARHPGMGSGEAEAVAKAVLEHDSVA